MSWSNTPPTAPGFYWVVFKEDEEEPTPAYYEPGSDGWDFQVLGSDEFFHKNRFKLFHPMQPAPALPPT